MNLADKDPVIKTLTAKKLAGKRVTMSFADNRTAGLWKSFMPLLKDILNKAGEDLFSLQIYPEHFFKEFRDDRQFEKWAAVEVTDNASLPEGIEIFDLTGGLYAVFLYHGAQKDAEESFKYILGTWLPRSGYTLDKRPHFEVLGEKYRNDDPDSEEELWIPIKPAVNPVVITPWFTVRNSREAIDFYKSAFGAVEVYRMEGDGDDLVARLSVSGAEFWISNGKSPKSGVVSSENVRMILTVPDPDSLFQRALGAGAREVFPVGEAYGWRVGRLSDPFGFDWEIGRELN
jgi:AraC family transcriptional regulator